MKICTRLTYYPLPKTGSRGQKKIENQIRQASADSPQQTAKFQTQKHPHTQQPTKFQTQKQSLRYAIEYAFRNTHTPDEYRKILMEKYRILL